MKGSRSKGAAKADTKPIDRPVAEAPPCTPSSWSDIPLDIAGLVLGLLPAHADLARFAAVCPKWRAAAWRFAARQLCLLPPLPVIALPDGFFYSLPRGERFPFPVCGGRYHSTCGNWLVFSRDDGFFLVDPFSNATMTLPGLSCVQPRWEADDEPVVDVDTPTWMEIMEIKDPKELAMHKLIVCSPHLVAALVGFPDCGVNQIVVCRPGASSWSVRAHDPFMRLRGMALHHGKLYALDCDMGLHAVDISEDHSTRDPWVSGIRLVIKAKGAFTDDPWFKGDDMILTMPYLVESHGALLMARRNIWCGRITSYPRTSVVPTKSEFEVFEADFGRSRWNKVTTVGDDQVLFLARWSSRAVSVSKYGMPGNRIFFWDDDLYHHQWLFRYDKDSLGSCSAYDMGDGTVSSPLPMISWGRGRVPETWEEFHSWRRGGVPATWLFPRD